MRIAHWNCSQEEIEDPDFCKYIVVQDERGDEVMWIFPRQRHTHKEAAAEHGSNVISAGFILREDDTYVCFGESMSLMVRSRSIEDSAALRRHYAGLS